MSLAGWARTLAAFAALLFVTTPALAQQRGGTLRVYHRDNPPSAAIHEEATISTVMPFMPVFNNLVVFNQATPRASTEDLTPELATS